MANLTATPALDSVPQLETTTLALGGAGGVMNSQAQALLNRLEHHKADAANPHGVTKADVELGNCDNTSDATKLAATIAALLAQNNTWNKAQRGAMPPLTSAGGSIDVDLDDSNSFKHILTENTTLAAPTHAVEGQSGVIHFTQHASAAKTLAFNAFWYFGATTPTISATLGAKCAMSYIVEPGATRAICSMGGDVA